MTVCGVWLSSILVATGPSANAESPASATASVKPRVVVMELATVGEVTAELARAYADKLLLALRQDGRYDEIGYNDFRAMLGHEALKQAVGCTDDVACMAEIAGAAGVDLLLGGTLLEEKGTFTVLVTLIDSAKAKVSSRVERRASGGTAALFATAPAVINEAFPGGALAEVVRAQAAAEGRPLLFGIVSSSVAVGALAGGVVCMVLAGSAKSDADALYAEYRAAASETLATELHGQVDDKIHARNTRAVLGYSLFGVGALAAGWAIYQFLNLPEANPSIGVAVGPGGNATLTIGGGF